MVGLTGKVARHESIPAMLMPSWEGSEVIGCKEHKKKAVEIIDKSITLVKDTKNIIAEVSVKGYRAVRNICAHNLLTIEHNKNIILLVR